MNETAVLAVQLNEAIQQRDGELVERIMRTAFQQDSEAELAFLMRQLCVADWHCMHEDSVSILQRYGGVHDIPALEAVVGLAFPYLAYEDTFSLARRAIWAIADIGGNEALQALARIELCSNQVVANYAKTRLLAWNSESLRKRN